VKSNIEAGKVVAGGSTLTQQTAKNLFQRPDRSFSAKGTEALNALRLEHYYDKEQILEFYANQFHVNANGRGIAIAARYFFNSSIEELSLIECAFIAGMVKGPNLYDPLNKKTAVRREAALKRAHRRTQYVLDRMYALEKITEEQYQTASSIIQEQSIPFERGVFRFDSNVITQEVARRLEEPSLRNILREVGIDEPSTAGLQIVTTIDEETQRRALYGLRSHLSDLGAAVKGAKRELLVDESLYISTPLEQFPQPYSFHYAKIIEKKPESVVLDIRGHRCTVSKSNLRHTAKLWKTSIKGLQELMKIDNVLYVRVDKNRDCIITPRTDLEGGVLAVQQGEIRAMVGGQSNKDLNRSLDSERQLGSVWKTLIYTAALQLGWTEFDMLDNIHNAFYFERSWYFPNAAHKAPDFLSMNWVGTHSENKASVWLLYHLSDQLSVAQMGELAQIVGLTQGKEETDQEYRIRIRDHYGVISTHKDLEMLSFSFAKKELLSSFHALDKAALMSLQYGGPAFEKRIRKRRKKERVGLEHSWTRLLHRVQECDAAYQKLQEYVAAQDPLHADFFNIELEETDTLDPNIASMFWQEEGAIGCGYTHREKPPLQVVDTWKEVPPILYDGYFSHAIVMELQRNMKKYQALYRDEEAYSLKVLLHHHDFQFVLHARYIALLAKKIGVEKNLSLRMSLPLGVTDISLAESIAMYEGLLTGQRTLPQNGEMFQLIDKIYYTPHPFVSGTSEPQLLYDAQSEVQQVSHKRSGERVLGILHNVVKYGTGRRLQKGVQGYPVFAKTGTTNKSLNAAFCGVIPSFQDHTWSFEKGLYISSYVGFDIPKKMRKGRYGVSGASGALPIWKFVAEGAIDSGVLGEKPTQPWHRGMGLTRVLVDQKRGAPDLEGGAVIWGDMDDRAIPKRFFAPVRMNAAQQEELIHSHEPFADDTGVDILIPEE